MIVWREVAVSSSVARVGYSYDEEAMFVQYTSGRVYVYEGVPPEKAEQASVAWSVGKYLNEEINGKYPFHEVEKGSL